MRHITDDEIAGLPEDPAQRFVAIEAMARNKYDEEWEALENNDSTLPMRRRYMSVVLPAAKHYGIEALSDWKVPPIDADWQYYEAFMFEVDFAITDLRLKNIEQWRAHSVALNPDTKTKLRSMLDHIRQTVDKLDISVAKKEALYARIGDLQDEIDRNRTRWQAVAALMIEACDDVGEAAKRLEPVVRLIERVAGAVGGAKRAEDAQPKAAAAQAAEEDRAAERQEEWLRQTARRRNTVLRAQGAGDVDIKEAAIVWAKAKIKADYPGAKKVSINVTESDDRSTVHVTATVDRKVVNLNTYRP